ncbi:MAG: transglycosylase SLT domain-containing protein [Magnetovibrio sp.]|nr:transglycosylase SLT domain-containing protein [Magnetovibrio sp.]
MRPILAGLAAGVCLLVVQNAFAASPQPIDREAKTCERAIQYQERRLNIPKGLLNAISVAESGRWNASGQATIAWPWTVTTGGKGNFLPNRADAVAFVKSLQSDGVQNIDVGCMQINLKYHPDAFVSIEHAFDPNANAAYAADFLDERFQVSKSWLKAAGDYHSTTPVLNKSYRKKVAKIWHNTPITSASNDALKPALSTLSSKGIASAPSTSLTQRFNLAFQARTFRQSGQAIANRVNAFKPGASLNRPKGKDKKIQFAKKRRSQLMAWRQANGTQPKSAPKVAPHTTLMPTIPASINVQ